RSTAALFEVIGKLVGLFLYLLAVMLIVISHGQQNTRKAWHRFLPVLTVARREIGASIERTAVWREENGHGPATLLRQGLYCLHIDIVYIGSLFAVYLNRDKMLVHKRGNIFVLKGF